MEHIGENRPQPPHGGRHHGEHGGRSGGRITVYFLLLILMNVLLALYAVRIVGVELTSGWADVVAASEQPALYTAYYVVLFVSPVALTILFNILLWRLMRGKRHFSKGVRVAAILLIIAVQALTFFVLYTAGSVPFLESFQIETINTFTN